MSAASGSRIWRPRPVQPEPNYPAAVEVAPWTKNMVAIRVTVVAGDGSTETLGLTLTNEQWAALVTKVESVIKS